MQPCINIVLTRLWSVHSWNMLPVSGTRTLSFILIKYLERVQRRAARWVMSDFQRTSSVTTMLNTLGWRNLAQRRADSRLVLMYKIIHGLVAIPQTQLVRPTESLEIPIHSLFAKYKLPRMFISTLSFLSQKSSGISCQAVLSHFLILSNSRGK